MYLMVRFRDLEQELGSEPGVKSEHKAGDIVSYQAKGQNQKSSQGSKLESVSGVGYRSRDLDKGRKTEHTRFWDKEIRTVWEAGSRSQASRQTPYEQPCSQECTYLLRQLSAPFPHLSNAPQPVSGA